MDDIGLIEHKLTSIKPETPIKTKGKPMKTKEEYIESMATELKDWSAQIDILTAKSEKAAADVKLKYLEVLEDLRDKQYAAAVKMKELEEANDDALATVKQTADKIWDDLRAGIAGAYSKFE